MSGHQNQQVLLPSDFSLADLLELHRKNVMLQLNCHAVATIQSFNPTLQTATATINYKKSVLQSDLNGAQTVLKDYPILLDCPVICLGGGLGSLTFPIETGDECLVFFNDRDINNWFTGGTGSQVATPRMHSLSDGIIIVGVRSAANALKTYDPVRAVLQLGFAMVGVGAGGTLVKVAGGPAGALTLGTLMQSLLTDLSTMATGAAAEFTTQAGASTGPLAPLAPGFTALAATFTALTTALTPLAAQFAELLE